MARACALIAPVHTVLHRVSCSYEMIRNAAKHYTTHQNMSFGSNGVDLVHSLWKIPTWLCGTKFCFNCTSSPIFASSFMQLRNDPKCTKILQRSNGVDLVSSLRKISMSLRGMNFCINCTSSPCFAPSFMQFRKWSRMHPNTMKHTKTRSNGVYQVLLLRKITTWLRGTNLCINCSSSVCFASSFMQLRNDPKCTEI